MTYAPFPLGRPRRLRTRAGARDLVREARLAAEDLIQPYFVFEGEGEPVAIESMPGQFRWPESHIVQLARQAHEAGIRAIAIFPKIADEKKTIGGDEAWNPEGLVPRIIGAIKAEVPELLIMTDVALDPYSSMGQDGIVVDGRIDNDLTIAALIKQALCHAEAGADIVGPSDMMDGRVAAIREAFADNGHDDTLIMAYSAKYASAYYGPFRDALDSAPRGGTDKRTYQMDPGNSDEALMEVARDLEEGADIVMVKPGLPYLDIIRRCKETFSCPVAAYHVSGEYAMLKAAAANGWLDEWPVLMETLLSFRRAGADMILTYYAVEVAERLKQG